MARQGIEGSLPKGQSPLVVVDSPENSVHNNSPNKSKIDIEEGETSRNENLVTDFTENNDNDNSKMEDPFNGIIYHESVNSQKSCMGNLIGYIDYIDRYYSRSFQLLDHPFLNYLFLFFAWIFNKHRVMIQIPVVFIWAFL